MVVFFNSNLDDPEEWRTALAPLVPNMEWRVGPELGNPADIDVALVWRPPPAGLKGLPNLKAILALGAGVDQLNLADLPAGVPVARLVDPTLTQAMVEFCKLAALRYHRGLHVYEKQSRERVWKHSIPRPASSRSVGVLGLGELGGAVAADLKACGFNVSGWSRTQKSIPGVACHHGADGLDAFIRAVDILICLLPLTAQTENFLGKSLFERMKPGSYLINVGRGRHLVEADLLAAIKSGHIAHATLDVFRQEPLPQDHPFWGVEEILITPHVASTGGADTAAPQVAENIRRARAGEKLLNQVDPARGY